jgi:hypothetical protein
VRKIFGRIFAGIVSLAFLTASGFSAVDGIKSAGGIGNYFKFLELETDWGLRIGLVPIPGFVILFILYMIGFLLICYVLIYALTGRWPSK